MIYFDHNATTPLCDRARNVWIDCQNRFWGNPSAGYRQAAKAKAALERARETIATLLGTEADQLVFCSGATEACNLWLESFLGKMNPGETLLVSELDHSCVVETCKRRGRGCVRWFRPSSKESVVELLDREWSENASLAAVVMMAANNVTGEIFDWKGAAAWCRSKGIPFFCDTTQWIGKYGAEGLGELDFFCGSAHKFGGPKGVGFLKVSRKFKSLCGQTGGGQEGGIRAGTEDVAGVCSMVAALESYLSRCCEPGVVDLRIAWKNEFKTELMKRVPGVMDHDRSQAVLWNTVSLSLPEKESGWWIQKLDARGFAIAAGSACSTGNGGESRVKEAMGIDLDAARRSVRFSAGWQTTREQWFQLLEAIEAVYEELVESKKNAAASGSQVISLDDL